MGSVHSHNYFNKTIRRSRLLDKTHYWQSGYQVVACLKLKRKSELDAIVKELLEDISSRQGTEIVYIGKVFMLGAVSKQVLGASGQVLDALAAHDLLVVFEVADPTKSADIQQLLQAKVDAGQVEYFHCIGAKRKGLTSFALAQWLASLKLKAWLTRSTVDLETPSDPSVENQEEEEEGHQEEEHKITPARLHSRADFLQNAGQDDDPIYIWNWIQTNPNPQEQKRMDKYGLKMMEMLAQFGGGILSMATADNLENYEFDTVAAVYYPTRKFLGKLVRSEWMHQNLQDKQPGDTIAFMTTPYYTSEEECQY